MTIIDFGYAPINSSSARALHCCNRGTTPAGDVGVKRRAGRSAAATSAHVTHLRTSSLTATWCDDAGTCGDAATLRERVRRSGATQPD